MAPDTSTSHTLCTRKSYHALESLAGQGFGTIIVWRGCGEHRLHETVDRFNENFHPGSEAILPQLPYHDIWCRVADSDVPGGHADSFTTSISLYRRPETVRVELIPETPSAEPDWDDSALDFTKYSETGVIGDATKASAELGRLLWKEVIKTAGEILRDASKARRTT